MSRVQRIGGVVIATTVTVALVAAATGAFNTNEKKVIQNLRSRIVTLETSNAALSADVSQLGVDLEGLTLSFTELTDPDGALPAMAADIDTIDANQQSLADDIGILDAGLKGFVADDGPLAQLDRNIAYTQSIVFANHDRIALTDITPTVTCGATSCTVDVEWNSEPPATGQVEWGKTTDYGNTSRLETNLLGYHKQRLGTVPADGSTYHFRILATTPDASVVSADVSAS